MSNAISDLIKNARKIKGVSVIYFRDAEEGLEFAKNFLYNKVDKDTVLFLSGGETPKDLYKDLAKEKKLDVGVVGMVDERCGPPFHPNSNEKMIRDAGLIDYLASQKIGFYSILNQSLGLNLNNIGCSNSNLLKTAQAYDKTVHDLFAKFKKRIAIMGVGEDGHTAGLPPRNQKSKIKNQKYVLGIDDFPGEFKERITLTFKALEKMELLIVLIFGSSKKNALKLMFTKGSVEEIPARFYTRDDIAGKTVVITDQRM